MAFTLLQAGSSLQIMDTSGTLTTLTLPSGVLIDSSKPLRSTIFKRYIIVVNSPSRPITVDPEGVVRVLCPHAPRTRLALSGAGSSTLSGTFLARQSFRLLDVDGNLIAESPLGPVTSAATISSEFLLAADLDVAEDNVSGSRLYRTVTNGSVYLPWLDVDGNTQTSVQDDLADASLTTLTPPILGEPPSDLTLITEFKARAWGVSNTEIDVLRFTDASRMFAWPATYGLTIGRPGSDDRGITGLIARKEFLAVGRRDALFQIYGETPTDFKPARIKDGIGIEAPDSVVVHRDTAYWVGTDGVYSWGDDGVMSLTDGRVRSWFTTDTYFNRSRLRYAVGRIDEKANKYQVLLSAASSTDLDRWIELDLTDKTWWGPHKTSAFTPSWMGQIINSSGLPIPVIASTTGFLYQDQATRTDGAATGIAFDVDTKWHDFNTPDIKKHVGQLSMLSKVQAAGTLTITPRFGELSASTQTAISADMTLGRQKLRRINTGAPGRFLKLNFTHSTAAQDVELWGYELPWHEIARR